MNLELEFTIDGGVAETFKMSTSFIKRRHEVAWKYQLTEGNHTVKVRLLNPTSGFFINMEDMIVYSMTKPKNTWKTHN